MSELVSSEGRSSDELVGRTASLSDAAGGTTHDHDGSVGSTLGFAAQEVKVALRILTLDAPVLRGIMMKRKLVASDVGSVLWCRLLYRVLREMCWLGCAACCVVCETTCVVVLRQMVAPDQSFGAGGRSTIFFGTCTHFACSGEHAERSADVARPSVVRIGKAPSFAAGAAELAGSVRRNQLGHSAQTRALVLDCPVQPIRRRQCRGENHETANWRAKSGLVRERFDRVGL